MTATPQRIQLSRRKGWRLQEASLALNGLPAVKVDRTTRWGNPFRVGMWLDPVGAAPFTVRDAAHAVDLFRAAFYPCPATDQALATIRTELRGRNLGCWCKGPPCHADVLLALANDDINPTIRQETTDG